LFGFVVDVQSKNRFPYLLEFKCGAVCVAMMLSASCASGQPSLVLRAKK
jgi:hypothetical protein